MLNNDPVFGYRNKMIIFAENEPTLSANLCTISPLPLYSSCFWQFQFPVVAGMTIWIAPGG